MAKPITSCAVVVALKLDAEHKQLLNELIAVEKLNRSDVLRRAIRAYAKVLGIEPRQGKVA
jgi:metal-responsive CopG/Arc/MetJ family transcriptional regulator